MERCTKCEESFRRKAPLQLSVTKFGDEVLVYATNNSRNIIIIKRMLLCLPFNGGYTVLYIREGEFFDFYIGGERLEQGSTQLKFKISYPSAQKAQVEAEYIEITGRSVSCLFDFTS